jgi:RNA polymerase sigma-70 factor (ECF subfamily)
MEHAAVMSYRGADADLIDACRRGDAEAFRVLFETYKTRVYSIAVHFTGDEAAAKDVTQQVFLKLVTSLHQYRSDAAFSTWLFRLVANACVDEHRRQRRFVPFEPNEADEWADASASADDDLITRETAESVRRAVAALRPKLRIAILLRYFEGLTYDEIAEALGCSKGTVASRLNRGHAALASKLAHLRESGGGRC